MKKTRPIGKHIFSALIFLCAMVLLLTGLRVWEMTYLDFRGIEAEGTGEMVKDCLVRCTFQTENGRVISSDRYTTLFGLPRKTDAFLYLPERPEVFKLKRAGRARQLLFLVFFAAFIWELRRIITSLRKPTPASTSK